MFSVYRGIYVFNYVLWVWFRRSMSLNFLEVAILCREVDSIRFVVRCAVED